MVFTEHHILLNFPKTGSTWTRNVIKYQGDRLRKRHLFLPRQLWPENWWFEHLVRRENPDRIDQHGTRREMEAFKKKYPSSRITRSNQSVVTVWRDPFELFSSSYRYQWWNHWPISRRLDAQERFQAFPQWEAKHFYQYQSESQLLDFTSDNARTITNLKSLGIGWLGIKIILFYCSKDLFERITAGKFHSEEEVFTAFSADVQDITFMMQADLTKGLIKTIKLSDKSISAQKLELPDPVNTTSRNPNDYDLPLSSLNEKFKSFFIEDQKFAFQFQEYLKTRCN